MDGHHVWGFGLPPAARDDVHIHFGDSPLDRAAKSTGTKAQQNELHVAALADEATRYMLVHNGAVLSRPDGENALAVLWLSLSELAAAGVKPRGAEPDKDGGESDGDHLHVCHPNRPASTSSDESDDSGGTPHFQPDDPRLKGHDRPDAHSAATAPAVLLGKMSCEDNSGSDDVESCWHAVLDASGVVGSSKLLAAAIAAVRLPDCQFIACPPTSRELYTKMGTADSSISMQALAITAWCARGSHSAPHMPDCCLCLSHLKVAPASSPAPLE